MSEPYLCCLAFLFFIFLSQENVLFPLACSAISRFKLFQCRLASFQRSLSSLKYNATEGCLPCDVQSTTYISLKNFLMTTSCTLLFSQRKKSVQLANISRTTHVSEPSSMLSSCLSVGNMRLFMHTFFCIVLQFSLWGRWGKTAHCRD